MKKFLLVVFAWFSFMGLAFAATPVDLNSANQAQLESVTGIGPVKAKAVIEYRTKNGPFKSVDDLQKVTGFGKASVGKLRSEVTVGGAKAADVKASDAKDAGIKAADVKVDTKKSGK
ncbi:MAG: ComEA family DNA-binding protein [Sulfurimicrobium sp.]|nr:ComEA family DNA-binding protein [Sulfurimicrobium sp.]